MRVLTAPATIDVSSTPRVPFLRLVTVELRKPAATRAGRWLLGVTGALLVLAMVVALLVAVLNDLRLSFEAWREILPIPLSLPLPVIAITAITQERGQRASLVTFALEPGRTRVIAAKLVCVKGHDEGSGRRRGRPDPDASRPR